MILGSTKGDSDIVSSRLFLLALCLFAMVPTAESEAFLKPNVMLDAQQVAQALDQALEEAMGQGHGQVREEKMEARRARILPMFESSPKNMHGAVNREAVHYIVYRYFGAAHGWSIRGFESHDLAAERNATQVVGGTAKILRDKLPSYVESVLESRLEHDGFTVQDIVVMVTVLERMIMDESVEMLEGAYYLNEAENAGNLHEEKLYKVMESFMMIFSLKSQRVNRTFHEMVRNYLHTRDNGAGWPSGKFGAAETKIMIEHTRRQNPFREHTYSFDWTLGNVGRIMEGYGQWTGEQECRALKEGLIDLDREGNGRVRLPDFYAKKRIGHTWHLHETLEYLRSQGVVDESSPSKGPRLLVANYVQSLANCVDVSGFFSVCCLRECEGIMDTIERSVREPFSTVDRLIPVVQGLVDVYEEDPKNLTTQLKAQLDNVADLHQGKIPIHGRLFQQWLHYVFPHECPYPQLRDSVEVKLSKHWANATGRRHRITEDEYNEFVEIKRKLDAADAAEAENGLASPSTGNTTDMSQWSFEEELYIGHHHEGPRSTGSSTFGMLGGLMRVGVLLGGVLTLGFMVVKYLAAPPMGSAKAKPNGGRAMVFDVFV